MTVSGSIPGAGHPFQYVTNQPPKANSAFYHQWDPFTLLMGRFYSRNPPIVVHGWSAIGE